MKKGKKAALAVVCAVLFLVACGGKTDAGVTSEEIVVPEMSSEDLLVTSLEYLLEEESKTAGEEAAEQEEPAAKPPGQQEESAAEAGEPEQQEESEQMTATVVYYGVSGMKEETVTVEEITPEALIGALARHNIVPLFDTKVLSLREQEEDGVKILYLDFSGSFREYLLTMSEEAECYILASVVNTFLPNYDARAVFITVEGEPLVTSHAAYTQAIYDYAPGDIHKFMMSEKEEEDAVGQ